MANDKSYELAHPAGFWIRLVAYVIDTVVFLPLVPLSWWASQHCNIPVYIATFIPFLLYKPIMESRYGATLGKMIFQIRVLDGNGNKISLRTAYIRFIPFLLYSLATLILSIQLYQNSNYLNAITIQEKVSIKNLYLLDKIEPLLGLFFVVDCLVIAFRYRKKAIHDSMAGTFCVFKVKVTQESGYLHSEAVSSASSEKSI